MNPIQALFDKFVGVYKAEALSLRAEKERLITELSRAQQDLVSSQDFIQRLQEKLNRVPAPQPPPSSLPTLAPPPIATVQWSADLVDATLRSWVGKFGRNGYPIINYQNARVATDKRDGMVRFPQDAIYTLPTTLYDLGTMVTWARSLDTRPWTSESYDCDNRAMFLATMCAYHYNVNVGIVSDGHAAHAYNLAITGDGKIYLVEPEDIPPTTYPLSVQHYPMLSGVIWF
ncbi:MAG: hypothetical protein HY459_02815 [Parcubacteria group bacterium]|nr:hypothetical protein [Parcubacteria group bacterium]